MPTKKISIAIDGRKLALARAAAKVENVSLSAYIARALGKQLEDQERLDEARALHRSWGRSGTPTRRDRETFLVAMSRSRRRSSAA